MKIEIGESLVYSWLRHVKGCQLVQTNWTPSNAWELQYDTVLSDLMDKFSIFFFRKYNFTIFKKVSSLAQLLKQAEIDVIGLSYESGNPTIYAVDIAFHEAGLNYGDKAETLQRVIKKCIRSILCIYGYFGIGSGSIVFASPQINPSIQTEMQKCFQDMQELLSETELSFDFRLVCNEDFNEKILKPVIEKADTIADTTELFVRSLKLFAMYPKTSDFREGSVPQIKSETGSNPGASSVVKTIPRISSQSDLDFLTYLTSIEGLQLTTARARLSNCQRIEEFEGSISTHYEVDHCLSLLEKFQYSTADFAKNRPAKHAVPISGNVYTGTSTLKSALSLYIKYLHYLEQNKRREA